MDLRETYNKIAEDWHKDHHQDDWWVAGTDHFVSLLKHGDSVLDVGCGAGNKSKYLRGKGLVVLGIDFAENLIAIAKRENPDISFGVMDMHDVPSLPQEFDGIFAQASLLHIPKKEAGQVIQSLVSKLKQSGFLYVAVKGQREDGVEEEVKTEDDYGYSYERFFSYFTMEELTNYFEAAGLKIVYKDVKEMRKTDWLQIIGEKI
jgi:trans-aconitate methyltransferase